jgi:hypothetical protein
MRLTLLLILASVAWLHADDKVAGRWEGSAKIPGEDLKLIVDLAPGDAGKWNGSVSIPALQLSGALLDGITVNGNEISFTVKTALADQHLGPAKFHGQLSANGSIAGDFTQAGNTAQFALSRTGPPQVESPPRSTSIKPEWEGTWKGTYEMMGYPRSVTLKLMNRGAEGASAEWEIVGKKDNKLPVDLVTESGAFVTVDSHETGLSFEGSLANNEVKGTILQGPYEIPVTLRRDK